jgi:uncharacterized membrane protein YfcA
MDLQPIQYAVGACSGGLVGASLGLFGGGGSILAVPLLVYLVGISDVHVAIGTSALAVSANAVVNLAIHARRRNVNWRCAMVFAAAGVAGAVLGSLAGKSIDGSHLLLLFSMLMMIVAALMFGRRTDAGNPAATCTVRTAPKTMIYGVSTGALSGFFGIGGGFLIVPGLMAATGMPMLMAVGSSLVAVAAFGLTTTISYASAGLVDWVLAADFLLGGIVGGLAGVAGAQYLESRRGMLVPIFSAVVFVTAMYVAVRAIA